MAAHPASAAAHPLHERVSRERRHRLRRLVLILRYVLHRFRWRMVVFAVILASSATALHLAGWLDTGNGPGNEHVHPSWTASFHHAFFLILGEPPGDMPTTGQSPLVHILMYALPILGLTVILEGFAQAARIIVRIDSGARDWVRFMAHRFQDHVVLCGFGRLGYRIFQELLEMGERRIVVLDKDDADNRLAIARKAGLPVLVGDGRHEGVLQELNVAQARAIVLATDDDLANLEIGLDARRLNPGIRVVMRVWDPDLAKKLRSSFDIQMVFSTKTLAAPTFAAATYARSILHSYEIGEHRIVVAEITIPEGSELAGRSLVELRRDLSLVTLALQRAGEDRSTLHPDAELSLEVGDRVTFQTSVDRLPEIHARNRDSRY